MVSTFPGAIHLTSVAGTFRTCLNSRAPECYRFEAPNGGDKIPP